MSRLRTAILGIGLLLVTATGSIADDNVSMVDGDDIEMNAAIIIAQDYLPTVLDNVAIDETQFHSALTLKVEFQADAPKTDIELMWVSQIKTDGDMYTGQLQNEPRFIETLKLDDQVTFELGDIRDRAVLGTDGRLYGHFTTRVLLDRMSEDESRPIREVLSHKPWPSGWTTK